MGMIHTAKRLIPYGENKVIHVAKVDNPVLLRLLKDERSLAALREGLKEIDPQYEILIPYRVDDEEAQLKRYIQWKMGTTVNLSELRRRHLKYYLRLYDYGSPAEVIRRWGLTPVHDHIRTEEALIEAVKLYESDDGAVRGLSKDRSLYQSLLYYSRKAGMSVKAYLESKGIRYKS